MEWLPAYSVHIEEIDAQHKELLGHFSAIGAAITQKNSWAETHFEIVALREFAHFHFRFEDALMRLYACPEREQHNRIHQKFFRTLESYEELSLHHQNHREVLTFFETWLLNHIQGDDRAYAQRILSGAKVVSS